MHLDGQPRDIQPGGRQPAPGHLATVQAFINSNYDLEENHGAELLGSPEALEKWLWRRHLIGAASKTGIADLKRAVELREALRGLLIAKHDGRPGALEATMEAKVSLGTEGPSFMAADDSIQAALDLILAWTATAMLDGTWSRLKACRECSWAFYDHSRNGAGNWCSMKVCGGRIKQRRHYEKTRRAPQS
jgi:predicted RNA-binding Zn ribbon-like protein